MKAYQMVYSIQIIAHNECQAFLLRHNEEI